MQQIEHRTVRLGARAGRQLSRAGPDLREARRTANRKQTVGDLRCECGQLGCRSAIPAGAEAYRGTHGGFVVVPGHIGNDVVVAAADRFFVVQLRRRRESS